MGQSRTLTSSVGLGIFTCFMFSLGSLAITYRPHALAIFALSAFFRSVFASVGPLYAQPAIQTIGVAWFTTILAIAATFMIPLPFSAQTVLKCRARSPP